MESIHSIIEEFNPSITEDRLDSIIRSFLSEINNITEEKFEIIQNYRYYNSVYDFQIRSGDFYCIIEVFLPNMYEIEEFQIRLRYKLNQIQRYAQQDPHIKGIILTSLQDWYIIDLEHFELIEYFNYRNFRNLEDLKRLKQLFIYGFNTYESSLDLPINRVFTQITINDFFNLMVQDNAFESSNIDNKSCQVSFPVDERQFAYVMAEVRHQTSTEVTFKYNIEGGITREVRGKRYIIPRCDKPSCRRFFGVIKTRLESITGVLAGYCCPKCYKNFFVIDPETKKKIIDFDVS